MKVIDPGSTALSNAEVLAHISSVEAEYALTKRKPPSGLHEVTKYVKQYLEIPTQPTARPDVHFSPESIARVVNRLKQKPYELLKGEVLQLLNHVPKNKNELETLLEEMEQRFSEQDQEGILKVLRKSCPVQLRPRRL